MHIDQKLAHLLQSPQRDGLIVQISFGAAIGKAFAADEDFIGLLKIVNVPPALKSALFRSVESSVNRAFLCALADLLGLKTATEQEPQRVKDNRLPSAGFPGEDV